MISSVIFDFFNSLITDNMPVYINGLTPLLQLSAMG